jgi:transposase
LYAGSQSLSKIAGRFKVGKATVHSTMKAVRTAARAPAPATPAKAAKTSRKAAAGA